MIVNPENNLSAEKVAQFDVNWRTFTLQIPLD